MIKELIDSDCIKLGNWKLKNGDTSKYYFNMKNLISKPTLLCKIGEEIYKKLDDFDIICGIPYGGLPIALYISITYNKPLIFIRDKEKEYGTQQLIEGTYKSTDRCIIIDDVITSGKSMEETIKILTDKVKIVDVAVIMDRQQNYTCSMPIKTLFYKNDIVKYMLNDISKTKNSKLCFAADIVDPNKLLELLDELGEYIVICKIHYDIIDVNKYKGEFKDALISSSIKHNFLIMEDRKFVDISEIVKKQYGMFCNWVDLVTVHALVSTETIAKLSGAMIIASMSNNDFDLSEKAITLASENKNNVVGFITQNRIYHNDKVCMTPGISHNKCTIGDQYYRNINNVDTDYIIVGRALYNSTNIKQDIQKFIRY